MLHNRPTYLRYIVITIQVRKSHGGERVQVSPPNIGMPRALLFFNEAFDRFFYRTVVVIIAFSRALRRRAGVHAKGGGPLHGAAAAGRTPRGAVHAAGLPVARLVQERREPNVRQQPGRVPGAVAVPPGRPVVARGRVVDAAEPGRRRRSRAPPVVVRVAAPQPPPVGVGRRSAGLEATEPEQGGPRLLVVPHQELSPIVRRKLFFSSTLTSYSYILLLPICLYFLAFHVFG